MAPYISARVTRVTPYPPGKPIEEVERELGVKSAIKIASNENPFGPSPKAVAAACEAMSKVHRYPDASGYYLRRKLAGRWGVEMEQVVLGAGTNEHIQLAPWCFAEPGDNAIIPSISFAMYPIALKVAGLEIRDIAMRPDLGFDLDAIIEAVDDRTRLVFVCNPNNPTGRHIGVEELDDFVARLPPHPILVLDEAYAEYVSKPHRFGTEILKRRPNTIVLRTFSKVYGLAGLRCGYAITTPQIVETYNRARQPFNVSIPAQVGAMAALDDRQHLEQVLARNRAGLEALDGELRRRGFDTVPSEANFVLFDLHRTSQPLFDAMLRLGVITRPMRGYGLPTYLRVTVGTEEENARFLEALDEALRAVGPSAS